MPKEFDFLFPPIFPLTICFSHSGVAQALRKRDGPEVKFIAGRYA